MIRDYVQNQFDRDEIQLDEELASGLISQEQFNRAMRQLRREYREAAEDAAEEAYRNEYSGW